MCLFTANSYAQFIIDLTEPDNVEVADMFPQYEVLVSMSFNDLGGNTSILSFKESKDREGIDASYSVAILPNSAGEKRFICF